MLEFMTQAVIFIGLLIVFLIGAVLALVLVLLAISLYLDFKARENKKKSARQAQAEYIDQYYYGPKDERETDERSV